MALRNLCAGSVLALALAACSGSEPGEDTAANEPSAMTAPEAAAPAPAEAAAPEEAMAAEPAAEVKAEAEKVAAAVPAAPAPKPAAAVVAAAAPAPVAEVIKVAEIAPPASYNRCLVCHTANKGGENKLGPNLYGVFGSAAGKGSFSYSAALKDSGLVWDEATLHKWLENPRALVPGNRMSFPGLKDAAKRQEIIDFLKKQS